MDVKVKHVSATRRVPLMSVHTKNGFQMVNYCETEKEEFLKQEIMELTELKKVAGQQSQSQSVLPLFLTANIQMNHEDCDDSKDDDFVMVSNVPNA